MVSLSLCQWTDWSSSEEKCLQDTKDKTVFFFDKSRSSCSNRKKTLISWHPLKECTSPKIRQKSSCAEKWWKQILLGQTFKMKLSCCSFHVFWMKLSSFHANFGSVAVNLGSSHSLCVLLRWVSCGGHLESDPKYTSDMIVLFNESTLVPV